MQLRAMMPKVTCVMAGSNMTYTTPPVSMFGNMMVSSLLSGLRRRHVYQSYGASAVACIIRPLVELTKHYLDEGAVGGKSRSNVIVNGSSPLLHESALPAIS